MADARKASLEAWLAERRADVEVLAWDADLVSLCVEQTCPKGFDLSRPQNHLDNLTRFSGLLGSYLFTPGGQELLSSDPAMAPCPKTPQVVRRTASSRQYTMHDVHWGPDDRPMLGFLAPVFHRADARSAASTDPVVGVVGLYLDPEKTLFPLVSGRGVAISDLGVYLVRREGVGARIISPPPGLKNWKGLNVQAGRTSVALAALRPDNAVGTFTDFRGRRVLAATRWLADAGWGLVVEVDEDVALSAWRQEARRETALAFLGVLCLGLLGTALWRAHSVRRYRILVAGMRDREERLQALALGSDDVVFLKDLQGRHLLVNPATERLLGVPAKAALGRTVRDFVRADLAAVLEEHDREVLSTGRPVHREENIEVAGERRTFLAARIPLHGGDGTVQGLAGVFRDITDRKRDEEALARRARRLAELYRLSEELAQATDPRSVLDAALAGAEDALGFGTAGVVLIDEGRVTLSASRHLEGTFLRFVTVGSELRGIAARALQTGRPAFAEDYAIDPDALPEAVEALRGGSAAFIPLHAEGGVLGILAVANIGRRGFSDEEERSALEALGHMVGGAVARARSRQGLAEEASERRRAEERLRRLHESTAGLTGRQLFAEVARALSEELSARWVEVTQIGSDGMGRPLAAFEDGSPRPQAPFCLAGTPCGQVAEQGKPVQYGNGLWKAFPGSEPLRRRAVESYLGSPLLNSRGRVIGVLCAYGDQATEPGATQRDLIELYARRVAGEVERLETEERLSEAHRALDTVIQNLPGAVYRTASTIHRPVESISAGCEVLTGHTPEAFTAAGGLSLGDLIIAEDRSQVGRKIETALANGASYELEYRIHDREGSIRWVYDVGRPVSLPAGRLALEGVLLDYTERRTLEAQLTHSQRMEALGRLAGGVAHDFNNLLTAISGYAELLESRVPEGDRSHRPVREIVNAANRAADLTRQLLAFSRRQTVEPKVLDFNESVAGTLRMLGRLLGEDVALHLDLAPDVGTVRADPGQLEQVVLNLSVNARDAMPGGGRLTVRTAVESFQRATPGLAAGEYAVLEVSDTGVGVPADVQEHIFEPFFTTKEEGKGTGLGLATVYGVVTQAGGRVIVSSEVGKGTSFRVWWPRHLGAVGPHAPSANDRPRAGDGTRVLLAEDEESVRDLTAGYLRELGYSVETAVSGEEAMEWVASGGTTDVLVTDVVMPGMSGPDLARALRRGRPDLPIIFISGHTGESLQGRGIGDPGTTFLQKPFRLIHLAQALDRALGR